VLVPLATLALLIFALVIWVSCGHESICEGIEIAAEVLDSADAQFVPVVNKSKDMESRSIGGDSGSLGLLNGLRATEQPSGRLPGLELDAHAVTDLPFKRPPHWQGVAYERLAQNLLNVGRAPARIDDVKLTRPIRAYLYSRRHGIDAAYAPGLREIEISYGDFGALRQHKFASNGRQCTKGSPDTTETDHDEEPSRPRLRSNRIVVIPFIGIVGSQALVMFGFYLVGNHPYGKREWLWVVLGTVIVNLGFVCLLLCLAWLWHHHQQEQYESDRNLHSSNTVTQKYRLTSSNSCNTLIGIGRTDMPNVLDKDKQIAIISALTEGSSIRSIERITGVHRDTIMRLGVRVGEGCARLLDAKMRNLPCQQLQFDEVWGFIGKKQKNVRNEDDQQLGDVWTFCAIDSDTKIVPSFKVGKRDHITANAFVQDVANRMANRVQISSDALNVYVSAIEQAFGADVDFAQIIKTYEEDYQHPERKYSPAAFVSAEKNRVMGAPDMELVSTSHVERLNGTTRLHMRRLTRLTYAFSKKFENFEAAVALHFASYNFVKRHNTLRCTPAMAAGIERDFWTVGDLIEAAA
jgi:IS1 family transposase